ncbi:homeobox protein Hox-A3-like [Corticium candelabrum]|uniref:homeobox protein Hox-A3-like n=1 Tax=Corticium candelabrum TaxID=121492 RepID=UPI002E336687|nr:homeobox protein Hox-A3-like [Corticium candelabrum]
MEGRERERECETNDETHRCTPTGKRRSNTRQDNEESSSKQAAAFLQRGLGCEDDSETVSRAGKPPKRFRTNYTPQQLTILAKQYERSRYLSHSERVVLAQRIEVTEKQIKVWFQNRRSKDRQVITKADKPSQQTTAAAADSGPGGSPIDEATYLKEKEMVSNEENV